MDAVDQLLGHIARGGAEHIGQDQDVVGLESGQGLPRTRERSFRRLVGLHIAGDHACPVVGKDMKHALAQSTGQRRMRDDENAVVH